MSDLHKNYPENLDAAVDAYVAARARVMEVERRFSCSYSMMHDAHRDEDNARDVLVVLCVMLAEQRQPPNDKPPA